MVVNELSPAELERMRAAARPVQEKYIQAIGTEMMTAVQDDLKRQRGR